MTGFRIYEPDECGSDGYPFEWHKTVKHLVREHALHRCVRCHHPYICGVSKAEWSMCDTGCTHHGPLQVWRDSTGQWEPVHESVEKITTAGSLAKSCGLIRAGWRVLTVHHLRLGHDHKRDLRWWNLAALCQRCHLQIQGKVQMERVWPHEHSDWFKPYAAGWYAWSYLREDLTREQTMERLDELLGLELHASG